LPSIIYNAHTPHKNLGQYFSFSAADKKYRATHNVDRKRLLLFILAVPLSRRIALIILFSTAHKNIYGLTKSARNLSFSTFLQIDTFLVSISSALSSLSPRQYWSSPTPSMAAGAPVTSLKIYTHTLLMIKRNGDDIAEKLFDEGMTAKLAVDVW